MKRSLSSAVAVVACVAAAAPACSRGRNDERASFSPLRTGYLVELTGKRHRLVHDPISWLAGTSYDETHELELPRLEGTIAGREIKGFSYGGTIVISENRMQIALTHGDQSEHSSWNGTYVLTPKAAPSPQEIAAVRRTMQRGKRSAAVIAARRLMDMGRDGRRTVYADLVSDPAVASLIADDLSLMYIGRREKVERWVPEDLADLEKLSSSGDEKVMRVGISFLSCTEEGRIRLRQIARADPARRASIEWYLERRATDR